MGLVVVGGATPEQVDVALREFQAAGFSVRCGRRVEAAGEGEDLAFGLESGAPRALQEADAGGLRYVLVHHGADDGEPEGTYARAHHRVEQEQLPGLARRLRGRSQMLVTCLAFGFKNGIPEESSWVVDARCLENPYWVPELKPLDGRDARVRDYVLGQLAARSLLDGLEAVLAPLLGEYRRRDHTQLTVAIGCTGGRHRSVVLAEELARRLGGQAGVEVRMVARELD